jgi:hypothetical protein
VVIPSALSSSSPSNLIKPKRVPRLGTITPTSSPFLDRKLKVVVPPTPAPLDPIARFVTVSLILVANREVRERVFLTAVLDEEVEMLVDDVLVLRDPDEDECEEERLCTTLPPVNHVPKIPIYQVPAMGCGYGIADGVLDSFPADVEDVLPLARLCI